MEFFLEQIQGAAKGAGMGEGSEVAAAIVLLESGESKAGEGFGEIDFDEEEPFIVAEADVVFWAIFFNEFAFEEDGLGFGADGVSFHAPNAVDEGAGFEIGPHFSGGVEVLADAAMQVAGFADVDDPVKTIFEEIDPGFVREGTDLSGEIGSV
jgi:hypothetical protein